MFSFPCICSCICWVTAAGELWSKWRWPKFSTWTVSASLTSVLHERWKPSRADENVPRLFARGDSDHRNERHFGEHQRPAGISEGGKLHQWLQACKRLERNQFQRVTSGRWSAAVLKLFSVRSNCRSTLNWRTASMRSTQRKRMASDSHAFSTLKWVDACSGLKQRP